MFGGAFIWEVQVLRKLFFQPISSSLLMTALCRSGFFRGILQLLINNLFKDVSE